MEIINIPLSKGNRYNNPKIIVVHAMAEYIHCDEATHEYYKGKGIALELGRDYHAPEWLRVLGLSAHRLQTPTGQMIKCREDNQGAWHAKGYNTDTLGIEFLVPGVHNYQSFLEVLRTPWLTEEQFINGAYVVKSWMTKHDIGIMGVKTHAELSPDRKVDPGKGFPLEDFYNKLKE